jgi:hypothetical protein
MPYRVNYPGFDLERERRGRFSPKEYLIHSYEDCFLGLLRDGPWEEQHDAWIGPSAERRDLLILRDPFNLLASRIKSGVGAAPPRRALQIWKQHARQFLGERRYLPRSPVPIAYNAWFQSKSHRRRVAEELGLRFTDAALREVANTAGGSSFDGLRLRRRASQMRVLDRWREMAHDDAYRRLFDAETVRLAEAIFGWSLDPAARLQPKLSA